MSNSAAPEQQPTPPSQETSSTTALEETEKHTEAVRQTSFSFDDVLLDTILAPDTRRTRFALQMRDGRSNTVSDLRIESKGLRLAPWSMEDLAGADLLLPTAKIDYGDTAELDARILAHITKYVRLPDDVLPLVPLFIRFTWLAERSATAPILRFSGPAGSGKSRASKIIGELCMKPYFTNGSTTTASLFRNLERIGIGTTIIDEAEFRDGSDMMVTLRQVLKIGFERSGKLERCTESRKDADKGQRVDRFRVFGPKLVSAIDHDPDLALVSRCVQVHMVEDRAAMIELPAEYLRDVEQLQNMLLKWRHDHFFAKLPEPKRLPVKPRLLQLYWPLARMVMDAETPQGKATCEALEALFLEMQEESLENAKETLEFKIASALSTWVSSHQEGMILYGDLAVAAGTWGLATINSKHVGKFAKMLGLRRGKSHGGPRGIVSSFAEIRERLALYGLGGPDLPA